MCLFRPVGLKLKLVSASRQADKYCPQPTCFKLLKINFRSSWYACISRTSTATKPKPKTVLVFLKCQIEPQTRFKDQHHITISNQPGTNKKAYAVQQLQKGSFKQPLTTGNEVPHQPSFSFLSFFFFSGCPGRA